jgi:hypothetical protein
MATVSGVGTTYNLPNFHGELFQVSPVDTPFLSAIGGVNGAKMVRSKTWEWQTMDRRTSTANNAQLEGQVAPAGTNQSRANVFNVTEIHQSAIEVSYSKLAAVSQYAGQNVGAEWDDAVIDEIQLQTMAELQSMGVDIEMSFLNGTINVPTDNAATHIRKTQGVIGAITTNVVDGAAAALAPSMVDTLLLDIFNAGGLTNEENVVILAGAATALKLNSVYAAQSTLSAPVRDRTVGGMAIKTITTIFGTFGVLVDRWMPAATLAVVDLSECYPVFTEVPNKGVLFVEPLAKVGASEKFMIYGEVGLEYGAERHHGKLTNFI